MVSFFIFYCTTMLSKQYRADPWCSATPFSMHYKPHSRCRGPWGRNLTRKTKQDNQSHPWQVFWFFIARLSYRNNITLTLDVPPHPSRCITNLTHHAVPSPAEIPPEHQSRPIDHTHGEFFDFLLQKYVFVTKWCWPLMFRDAPSGCIADFTPHVMNPAAEL